MKREIILALWAMLMLFPTDMALSAWSADPTVNNPVCTATQDQNEHQIISDGSGGAIVTWQEDNADIRAQRVDFSGNPQWTARGVPVCTATDGQIYPQLASDGSGGAIIAWRDGRSGGAADIYAQRVDSSGNILWTANGVPVCTDNNYQ